MTKVGEDVEKGEPWYMVGGMLIGTVTVENSMEIPQKAKK